MQHSLSVYLLNLLRKNLCYQFDSYLYDLMIASFLHAFVVLCYLQKLKRGMPQKGMALVFSAKFLYTFIVYSIV